MRLLIALLFPISCLAQEYSEQTLKVYDSLGVPWKFLKKLDESPLIEQEANEVRLLYYTALQGFKYYRLETDSLVLRIKESQTQTFSRSSLIRQEMKVPKSLVDSIITNVERDFFSLAPKTNVKGRDGYFIYIEAFSKRKYYHAKRWVPDNQEDGHFFLWLINALEEIIYDPVNFTVSISDQDRAPVQKAKVTFNLTDGEMKSDKNGEVTLSIPRYMISELKTVYISKKGYKVLSKPFSPHSEGEVFEFTLEISN